MYDQSIVLPKYCITNVNNDVRQSIVLQKYYDQSIVLQK